MNARILVNFQLTKPIIASPAPPLTAALKPSERFCVMLLPTMIVSEPRREIKSPTRFASKNSAFCMKVRLYSLERNLVTIRSPTMRSMIIRP